MTGVLGVLAAVAIAVTLVGAQATPVDDWPVVIAAIERAAIEGSATSLKGARAAGRVDAHAWLGQVLARKGDRAAARAEYDEALALAPNSGWVKNVLVPALERGARP